MILSPLNAKTEYNGRTQKNSNEVVKEVLEIQFDPDKELTAYDVSVMFTSVQINKSLEVINLKLEEDDTLSERILLKPHDIV